jgi:RNA polymerase sigma-70 factor (ECF subfamily)
MELVKCSYIHSSYGKKLEVIYSAMENVGFDQCLEDEEKLETDTVATQESAPSNKADELELQNLLARIVNRDQAAFGALFKAMSGRVYSLALRITGSIQLAEEVTEDVLFQVWRQAPRFDPARGTAKAWILTIARSRALDARRSIPPFESQEDHEKDKSPEHHGHDELPDLLSAIEKNHQLHNALEKLDPLPRQLIALSFFRGLSHEEISVQANLPLGTVKSHLRRAVISLREALAAQARVVHQ